MVVGLGSYKDKNEAYPLDKATLNKVALRSILSPLSLNTESYSSIGWSFALEPALRKIHTNEEDLALAMGHNLEYVRAITCFAPLAMGASLALEATKNDLDTIRSVRTTLSSLCDGVGLLYYLFIIFGSLAAFKAGDLIGIGFDLIVLILGLIIRIVSIRVGYAHATKIAEKLNKKNGNIKAFKNVGLIMLGSLIMIGAIILDNSLEISLVKGILDINYLNALISLAGVYIIYNLLTKKNYSMGKCVLVILVASIILGVITSFI